MPRGLLPASVAVACFVALSGCASMSSKPDPSAMSESRDPTKDGFSLEDFSPEKVLDRTKRSFAGQKDEKIGRAAYEKAEDHFRKKEYDAAAEQYTAAAYRWPDSQLEEDSLFMLGECAFFTDRYPDADKAYDKLIKKYSTTEHIGTISRRRFAMAKYWQAKSEKEPHWAITPNFSDKERPLFDTPGRAVKALETIMLTDPRGPLSDDAIMEVADAMFNKRNYDDADFRYKMIMTDYPQSKFLYEAHERSLRCKLLKYQGPEYDGKPLQEADELVEQMLTQFPDRVGPDHERLLGFKKEVAAHKQVRDFNTAEYYAKNGYNYAAKQSYAKVIKSYPKSNLTEQAIAKLGEIKSEPDNPDPPLAWALNWGKEPNRTVTPVDPATGDFGGSTAQTQTAGREARDTTRN